MIVTISGSPGTGKTLMARYLSKTTGFSLVEVKKLKIRHGYDRKRKSRIINPSVLKKKIREMAGSCGNLIVEGIPSHSAKSDIVIILRCRPDILRRRLRKRKWPEKKIIENVQAEILDAITIDALEENRNVYEIDTSGIPATKAAAIAMKIIEKPRARKRYMAGKIDWTGRYGRMLLKL